MKVGRKLSVEICDSLEELLKTENYPENFVPFQVTLAGTTKYCFAKTAVDAKRKVLSSVGEAKPVSLQEILQIVRNK